MRVLRATVIVLLSVLGLGSQAQTQLVLLNREKVLVRFNEGQAFSYKLKKSKGFLIGYIIKIQEFSVITGYDTIPFSAIDRISLKGGSRSRYQGTSFTNLAGSFLLCFGVMYFGLDEVNSALVHGQGFDNDKVLWEKSAILISSGLILKMIRKKSQRLKYPARLLAAPKGSPFWRPEE